MGILVSTVLPRPLSLFESKLSYLFEQNDDESLLQFGRFYRHVRPCSKDYGHSSTLKAVWIGLGGFLTSKVWSLQKRQESFDTFQDSFDCNTDWGNRFCGDCDVSTHSSTSCLIYETLVEVVSLWRDTPRRLLKQIRYRF